MLKKLLVSYLIFGLVSNTTAAEQDLINLSLEELLNVRITTANKTEKTVSKTAASVTVITKQQIELAGWRDLPELLNAQTGFFTFSDRIYDFVVARGNYQSNDPNSRVLLLLNGHSVIEGFGYFNGHLSSVDINHIERVEIVRGPGSAIYGTNAMFAVINVITRADTKTDSLKVSLELGESSHRKLALRGDWNEHFGKVSMMVSSLITGESSLFFDEYVGSPHPGQGITLAEANKKQLTNFYFDANFGAWKASAYFNHRTKNVPSGVFGGSQDDRLTFFEDTNTFFEIGREFKVSDSTQAKFRGFYDNYEFKGRYYYLSDPLGIEGPPYESEFNRVTDASYGFEVLFNRKLNSTAKLLYGAEYKRYGDVNFIYVSENDPLQLLNERFSYNPDEAITSLFTSLDYDWNDKWSSVLGLHYDYYNSVGGHLSLRASANYEMSPRARLKFLYGEAFRAPNSWELNGGFFLKGNQELSPEQSKSFEIIFDYSINDSWHWHSSVYQYKTDNNIQQSSITNQFTNVIGVDGSGLESELRYSKGFNAGYLSYSYSDIKDSQLDQKRSFYPDNLLKLGFTRKFGDWFILNIESQWIGERLLSDPGNGILPEYNLTNVNFSQLNIIEGLELRINIHNVFDEDYQHPAFTSDLASFNINSQFPVFDIPAEGRQIQLQLAYQWN